MGLDDMTDDEYSRQNKDYPHKKKVTNSLEDSPGLGGGTAKSPDEISGDGPNDSKINSFTSGHDVDSTLYNGSITEEDYTGVHDRTEFRGGKGSPTDDAPNVMPGATDDPAGEYQLKYTPNDSNTDEVAINNFLRFQNQPSKRRLRYNGYNVSAIE